MENEQAVVQDGTAKPVSRETKISGANGDREKYIFSHDQLTTSRIGDHTRLIHTLLKIMYIHTYRQYFQHAHLIPIVGVGERSAY